eukprot:754982-Hanusia_phi.AAC.2
MTGLKAAGKPMMTKEDFIEYELIAGKETGMGGGGGEREGEQEEVRKDFLQEMRRWGRARRATCGIE